MIKLHDDFAYFKHKKNEFFDRFWAKKNRYFKIKVGCVALGAA